MKGGTNQQVIEHPPLQRKSTKSSHQKSSSSRAGTALSNHGPESRQADSMNKFGYPSHDDSLPLRRRPLPLPPSGQQSYAATNSSNLLLDSQLGLYSSSTSSLQQIQTKSKAKKTTQHQKRQVNKSNGTIALVPASSARHKSSHQSFAKENSSSNANHTHSQKHLGQSTQRSEHQPAGPQSSQNGKNPYPKVQSARRPKTHKKEVVPQQDKKLHALQLQFMQETLTRLQKEKKNRSQAMSRAIQRKQNNSQLARRATSTDLSMTSGSVMTEKRGPSEGRRSKLQESFISQSSRQTRSQRGSRCRSRNESTDSRGNLLQISNKGRIQPRLCELMQLQDEVMNQSELLPFKGRRNPSSERVASVRSSQSRKIRPSSRSSSDYKNTKQKQAKKKSIKLPKCENLPFKKTSKHSIDDSMKRRQAKIQRMEDQFVKHQIDNINPLQLNEMSVIQSQDTTMPYQYATQIQQVQQPKLQPTLTKYSSQTSMPQDMFVPPQKFQISDESEQVETEIDDQEDAIETQSQQLQNQIAYQQEQLYRSNFGGQQQQQQQQNDQFQYQQQFQHNHPQVMAYAQAPLQMNQQLSNNGVQLFRQHQSLQVLPHMRSATDEKLPPAHSTPNHVMSQITIPQIGSIQHIGCFDVNSSINEQMPPLHPHSTSQQHAVLLQQVSSQGLLSLDGVQQQQTSVKKSSTNRDQRTTEHSHGQSTPVVDFPRKMPESNNEASQQKVCSNQNKIVNFFETEYRNAQKELIASKSELYEQKYKTDLLKKKVSDYEELVERMNNEMIKISEENCQLKAALQNQNQTIQRHPQIALAQPMSQRSGSLCNKDLTTHRTASYRQSDMNHQESTNERTNEIRQIREENQQLVLQNSQLVSKLDGLTSAQKSSEVLIQYLQGTQNSILQKMQHQMIKSQFTQNLVETAQLANNFISSGENSQQKVVPSVTDSAVRQAFKSGYNSVPSSTQIPSSLDLQHLIAMKKEDIGQSIEEYFKKSDEAAGLSDEKINYIEPFQGSTTSMKNQDQSSRSTSQPPQMTDEQKQSQEEQALAEQSSQYFGSGLILPEDCQDITRVINQTDNSHNRRVDIICNEMPLSHQGENYHAQDESSILNDYDSKHFSENHRQHQLQKRLNGISPVTNLRRADSRRSLSYQKSNQNQNQQSSNKGGAAANNDVSLISLSHVNSNSKFLVPKQMRQLLRKHSSEDGEIEDYLQTGAFEKRSNEMRLFSLDGTAQQDIQNIIELSQSNQEEMGENGKILSPVKDFLDNANDSQSNQLLNRLQNMQEPLSKVNQAKSGVCSPEILNQMRQKIMFSGTLKESGDKEEDDASQLSSPEMNCTQTDSKVTTSKNGSMKTKDQKEMQAIIATTKQFTCGSGPMQPQGRDENDYISQAANNLHLQDFQFPKPAHRFGQPPIKSPSFNQAMNLPILSKETSPQIVGTTFPDGNASQEMYSKTQNSMNMHTAASARPHSTCKVSSDMIMTKNEPSDERSITTISASFLHNIKKNHHMVAHHRQNSQSMTSHDTVPVDYFLQRENTQGSYLSGLQYPMGNGTLTHMPTEQCIPRLTSSFQHQLKHGPNSRMNLNNAVNMSQVSGNNSSYSPFKTHQAGQFPSGVVGGARHLQASSGRRPHHFSQSRSTSPNPTCGGSVQPEYCSNREQAGDLAGSSERIQKRTKKMKAEIQDIDRDIAMLHNVINQ